MEIEFQHNIIEGKTPAERLARRWNVEQIGNWLDNERLRMTPAPILTDAMGEILAHSIVAFARNMTNWEAAIMDQDGLMRALQRHLPRLMEQEKNGGVPIIGRH